MQAFKFNLDAWRCYSNKREHYYQERITINNAWYAYGRKLIEAYNTLVETTAGDEDANSAELPFHLTVNSDCSIDVNLHVIKGLGAAKKLLKQIFPTWKFELSYTSVIYGSQGVARWEVKKDEADPLNNFKELISICLFFDVTKAPKELLPSADCKFEKQEQTTYKLVCPMKEG